MKKTVTFSDFTKAFHNHGREDNFSYDALRILFDFLEEYDAGTGQESELDVVAICCDFTEETWQEAAENCSIDLTECEDDDEREQAVLEHLYNNTIVCGETNADGQYQPKSIVFQQF